MNCGSAGALLSLEHHAIRTGPAAARASIRFMSELKPWKMKKGELVEALNDKLIDYDEKATAPELREILKKHLDTVQELAKGYTRFTVGELREMCDKKKLKIPEKANKGCLIQLRCAEGGRGKEEITGCGQWKRWPRTSVRLQLW